VFLWSALGQRERRNDTGAILFSCARPVSRLLPAAWLAGAALALALGASGVSRIAAGGDVASALGWLLCAALVPAAALASGVWSGSSRFFEVLYLFLWYGGPMHHVAELDYTGVTAPRTPALWVVYAAITVAALAAAWLGRARQVRC